MLNINKKFVTNETDEKIAVQIDIKTFEQIENILENYGLVKLMEDIADDESLDIAQAKSYYDKLPKL